MDPREKLIDCKSREESVHADDRRPINFDSMDAFLVAQLRVPFDIWSLTWMPPTTFAKAQKIDPVPQRMLASMYGVCTSSVLSLPQTSSWVSHDILRSI